MDARFPDCVKLWESVRQAPYFRECFLGQDCLVLLVKQHMSKASRHQHKRASVLLAIVELLQDVLDLPT